MNMNFSLLFRNFNVGRNWQGKGIIILELALNQKSAKLKVCEHHLNIHLKEEPNMTLKPLADRVVIKRLEAEETTKGVALS